MFESVISNIFDAVALLRYGHFDESTFLLRVALVDIQKAGHLDAFQGPQEEGKLSTVPIEGNLKSSGMPNVNQTSCFSVFNRGFIFEDASSLPPTDVAASRCASVCLYNMALGLHLKGLSTGESGYLRKASGLYRKVHTLLSTCTRTPEDSSSTLLLAALLNLIACESELHGHGVVGEFKSTFASLFSWATQAQCSAVYDQPDDFTFFTTSALLFCNQNLATAPAA